MIDINELRRKANSTDIVDHIDLHANIQPLLFELLDRLEAAEKAANEAYQRGYKTGQEEVEKERDALRAKIAEMERQEPVCVTTKAHLAAMENGAVRSIVGRDPAFAAIAANENDVPLYALPGAQPAPSVPDGWKLVPIVSTAEMDNAGADPCDGYLSTAQVVWDAMLAAAPEAKP